MCLPTNVQLLIYHLVIYLLPRLGQTTYKQIYKIANEKANISKEIFEKYDSLELLSERIYFPLFSEDSATLLTNDLLFPSPEMDKFCSFIWKRIPFWISSSCITPFCLDKKTCSSSELLVEEQKNPFTNVSLSFPEENISMQYLQQKSALFKLSKVIRVIFYSWYWINTEVKRWLVFGVYLCPENGKNTEENLDLKPQELWHSFYGKKIGNSFESIFMIFSHDDVMFNPQTTFPVDVSCENMA